MPSTFFGLDIASSGLNAFQAAVNTTANNISNVRTEGYTRQVANRESSEAIRVFAKYGTTGSGVTTTSITQVRDAYYDVKYWNNNSSLGLYEKKLYYLNQIEDYFIDDDSSKGFTTILNTMYNNLETLSDAAGDKDKRTTFIGSCQDLASYFKSVATGLERIQTDANLEVKSTVDNINALAEKISLVNHQINIIEMQGGHANELRDQRALLVDELSGIVPVEVKEVQVMNTNDEHYTGATEYTVKINGQTLVSTREYRQLECIPRENRVNQSDVDGLYDIVWKDTGNDFNVGSKYMEGSLKALIDVRDGNNEENFSGTVAELSGTTMVVKYPSQNTMNKMTIAEQGTLTINNRDFNFTGWEVTFDADGSAVYTFSLAEPAGDGAAQLIGHDVEVGKAIDFMGVPYYQAQMNEFLRAFSTEFNEIQMSGVDLNGDPMGAFFVPRNLVTGEQTEIEQTGNYTTITSSQSSYYKITAMTMEVNDVCMKDSAIFSTTADVINGVDGYELIDKMLALKDSKQLYRGSSASGFLQCMISDISVDTQETELFCSNHQNIGNTITNQRLSVSGVDEDEEALDLVKFQNAYNLAAKMISTMSEMYEQLILNTAI